MDGRDLFDIFICPQRLENVMVVKTWRDVDALIYGILEGNKERIMEAYELKWRYNPTMLKDLIIKWLKKIRATYKTTFPMMHYSYLINCYLLSKREWYNANPDEICSNASIQIKDSSI